MDSAGFGGAVYIVNLVLDGILGPDISGLTITLNDCTLVSSTASGYDYGIGGGAIGVESSQDSAVSLTSDNCLMAKNIACRYGGAFSVKYSATVRLSGCALTANTAEDGGGAIFAQAGDGDVIDAAELQIELDGCVLTNNSRSAIYVDAGVVELNNCLLAANSANGNSNGGALNTQSGTAILNGRDLISNIATYNDDAIYAITGDIYLYGCALKANSAINGRGSIAYSGQTADWYSMRAGLLVITTAE